MFIEINNDKLGTICVMRDSIMMVTTKEIVTVGERIPFAKELDIMKLFRQLNDIKYDFSIEDIKGNEEYFDFILIDNIIIAKSKVTSFNTIKEDTSISLSGNGWENHDNIEINCPYSRFKEIMSSSKKLEIPNEVNSRSVEVYLSTKRIVELICGPFTKYINLDDSIKEILSTCTVSIRGCDHGGDVPWIKFNTTHKESTDESIVFTKHIESPKWIWKKSQTYYYNVYVRFLEKEYKVDYTEISLANNLEIFSMNVVKKINGGEIRFKPV